MDPVFGFEVKTQLPGVPPEIHQPELSWSDRSAYVSAKIDLAQQLRENFRAFEGVSSRVITGAGPQ